MPVGQMWEQRRDNSRMEDVLSWVGSVGMESIGRAADQVSSADTTVFARRNLPVTVRAFDGVNGNAQTVLVSKYGLPVIAPGPFGTPAGREPDSRRRECQGR